MKKKKLLKKITFGILGISLAVLSSACGNNAGKTPDAINQNNQVDKSEKGDAEFTTVSWGDTVTTDFISMSLDSVKTAAPNLESPKGNWYFEGEDGKTFFYISGSVKNLGSDRYELTGMHVVFTFDDKYNYIGEIKPLKELYIEDYIDPLETAEYYMYVDVPSEVIDSYSKCTVKFAFNKNLEYDYLEHDFNDYEYCYQVNLDK